MEQQKKTQSGGDEGSKQGRDIPVTDLNDADQQDPAEEAADTVENEIDPQEDAEEGGNDPLNEALAEAAASKEALLRAHAEMENLRKRSERDSAQARKYALERIMQDLLQVVDSLERGLQVDVDEPNAGVEKLREGKQLTLKLLLKILTDHGLEVVDPVGEKFDPERHEAVGTEAASDDIPANTVAKVWQKGYVLNDRLLRPAMVVVAR